MLIALSGGKANFHLFTTGSTLTSRAMVVRLLRPRITGQGRCYSLQRDVPRSLGNISGLSDWREADLAFKQIYTHTHTKGRERTYRFSKGNALRRGRRKVLTFSASGSINIFSFLTCICLYSHLCVHSKHRGLSSTVGWPWLQALLRVSPRTLA